MDMQDIGALGSTYTGFKWIFIAAQSSDNFNQEQQIKGAIAHELCHYILRLVYENQEKPFRLYDHEASAIFENIVSTYKRLLCSDDQDVIDDECAGIISSVFEKYRNEDHVAELIVRVPQTLVQFAQDIDKCTSIEMKYNLLFDFYEKFVVPELKSFDLKKLEDIRKLNKNLGILEGLEQNVCEFSTPKDPSDYIEDHLVIIVTNIPKLFFISSYKYFLNKYANFTDSNVIIVTPDILKNQSMFCDYKKVLNENENLNIFVDCSAEVRSNLKQLIVNKSSKYFFVVFYDEDYDDLAEYLRDMDINITKKEVNFAWNDLNHKTQQNLIKSKVKFQRRPKIPLVDILAVESDSEDQIDNLYKIIDYQLLDSLINQSEITINVNSVNAVDDKVFKMLFLERTLVKKSMTLESSAEGLNPTDTISNKTFIITEISPGQILQESIKNSIILISDVAGTGKTWILKSIINTIKSQDPKKWVTLVDLKNCIEMLKSQKSDITFMRFMTQFILKSKNNYEKKIFEKMYKNGTTCILFDGYDEIAADYGAFMVKIFRSFETNNKNQLWITTRDYLEKDLQDKLHLNSVYKIKPFTKTDGVDLIASHWMIRELDMEEDQTDFKESKLYQDNLKSAENLCNKISENEQNLIGIPQFFAMVADVFKDNKITDEKISNFFIHFKFVEKQFEIWAYESAQSRKQDRIDGESKSLTYTEVHQYLAMRAIYPNISQFCQLIHDMEDWPDNKIADCGLVTKLEDNFGFPHKTLMEYFAADFIVKNLKNNLWQNYSDFFKFLIKFLTDPRFNIVRMFLNDALSDGVVLRKLDCKVHRFSKDFCDNSTGLENFSPIFKENQENLVDFFFIILKSGSYDKVKNLLHHNIREIINSTKSSQQINKLQSFYVSYLTPADLKDFLIKRNILPHLICCNLNFEVFENLLQKLEEEFDQNYVGHALMQRDHADRNLLSSLCWLKEYNVEKLSGILRIINKYLINEHKNMLDMIEQCDSYGSNILHICVEKQDEEALKFTWLELEEFYIQNLTAQKFKELISQQTSLNKFSLLHIAANCKNLEFHKTLWSLVSSNLENREDLWNFISKQDKNGYNFVHHLVSSNTASVVDFTFTTIKSKISDAHYQMILNSKGFAKRNLLQTAICNSKDLNLHQVLWKIFKNSITSNNELLDILNEVDIYFWNVFQLAASFTTDEIFEFIITELEQIGQIEEIRKILANTKTWKRSLLLIAAKCNKCAKFHEHLWKNIRKYFNSSEIMEIIMQSNKDGKNLLLIISEKNTQEITNLTWNEILKSIDRNEKNEDELIKMIQPHAIILKNILQIQTIKNESVEISTKNLLSDPFGIFPSKRISSKDFNDLQSYASCEQLEVHVSLWDFMCRTFEYRDELINLVLHKDKDGNNYLHALAIESRPEIIEFTFEMLKNNFSFKQCQDIIKSKGFKGRNLFLTAACASRNTEVLKVLLKNFRSSCKSEKDISRILEEVDDDKRNILECLMCFASPEVTNSTIEELKNIESSDMIKKLMENVNCNKENIAQSAIRHNKSIESHKNLWKFLHDYFDPLELMELIKHNDIEGKNILQVAVAQSPEEILKITWQKVTKIAENFDDKEMIELIQHGDNCGRNLMHLCIDSQVTEKMEFLWMEVASYFCTKNRNELFEDLVTQQSSLKGYNILHYAAYCTQLDFHVALWTLLKKTLKNYDQLRNLIFLVDKNGNNFLHFAVVENCPSVIEFTFDILQNTLNEVDYIKILQSTGFEGRNVIQRAICESENIEIHQSLWKIYKPSDKMFLEVIGHNDDHKSNIFHLLACFSTCEIFDLTVENLEKIASREEIKKLLISLDFWKRNYIQVIVESNKSLEFHKSSWTVINKHLDANEIFEMIKNKDEDGNSFFKILNDKNDQTLVTLIWNELSKFTNGNEQDQKELMEIVKDYDNILRSILKPSNDSSNLQNDPFHILTTLRTIQKDSNDLQAYVTCDQLKVHQALWDYLLKTFDNREELKNLIIQDDKDGNNFIHLIVTKNKIDIIKFTFSVIYDIFDDTQYLEIIKSKTIIGKNLLQSSLQESNDIKIIQFIMRILENSSKSDEEFFEFFKEVDDDKRNIMNICAVHSSKEVLELVIEKLEKIASLENIRQLLRNLNSNQRSVLQSAVAKSKPLAFLVFLWEIYCKYFSTLELSEIISNIDKFGLNILHNCGNGKNTENLIFIWNECENVFRILSFESKFKDLIRKQSNDQKNSVLGMARYCKNSEFHGTLWIFLLETFKDRNQLKNLVLQKSKNSNNYINILVTESNAEIFQMTVKTLKENLNEGQYREILTSKGFNERTILQRACIAKDLPMYQAVWDTVRDLYNSDAEFFKSLKECDKDNDNLIHLAARFGFSSTFEFTIQKIEEIASHDEVKKFLSILGCSDRNFLQRATAWNKLLEIHEVLWTVLSKYFNNSEIIEMIKHTRAKNAETNMFAIAVSFNTKEVLDFTWTKIKFYIKNRDDQINFLKGSWQLGETLHELAMNNKNDPEVKAWVENLLREYKLQSIINEESYMKKLKKLIL